MCEPAASGGETAELERLTSFLHGIQRHPDYAYSMTFAGNTAHTPRDGWDPNPYAPAVHRVNGTELYWMRQKEFRDD